MDTEGDFSQEGNDPETGDAEADEADGDQNSRQSEQTAPEETPPVSEGLEALDDPAEEGPDEKGDAGEDAAILEELLTDKNEPDTVPSEEEAHEPTVPTAETTEAPGPDQEPPPSAPSGNNETAGEETTDGDDVPRDGTQGNGLDEDRNDDADARAYEELVTGELDTESQEAEEILDLKEPAETQDGESPAQIDNERQPPPASAGASQGGNNQTDAFDTGALQTTGGLSDEERGDLEKLITGLKEASHEGISPAVMKGLRKQLKVTDARVAKLGKMVLTYDRKLKACYEVIRLHHEKTEIMNRRIDTLIAAMNKEKRT